MGEEARTDDVELVLLLSVDRDRTPAAVVRDGEHGVGLASFREPVFASSSQTSTVAPAAPTFCGNSTARPEISTRPGGSGSTSVVSGSSPVKNSYWAANDSADVAVCTCVCGVRRTFCLRHCPSGWSPARSPCSPGSGSRRRSSRCSSRRSRRTWRPWRRDRRRRGRCSTRTCRASGRPGTPARRRAPSGGRRRRRRAARPPARTCSSQTTSRTRTRERGSPGSRCRRSVSPASRTALPTLLRRARRRSARAPAPARLPPSSHEQHRRCEHSDEDQQQAQ